MPLQSRQRKAISVFLGYILVVTFVLTTSVIVQYWLIHATKQETRAAEETRPAAISCALAYFTIDENSIRCTSGNANTNTSSWWNSSFQHRKQITIQGYGWKEIYTNSTSLTINTTNNIFSVSHTIFINNYISSQLSNLTITYRNLTPNAVGVKFDVYINNYLIGTLTVPSQQTSYTFTNVSISYLKINSTNNITFSTSQTLDSLEIISTQITYDVNGIENYQIPVNITYTQGMQNDFDDIRFVYPYKIYKVPITIQGHTQNLNDYQVKINITNPEIISKIARIDAGDIRFFEREVSDPYTETQGKLPYWVEKFDKTTNELVVWIKVNLTANTPKTVYMYYGRADVESESNGDAVFEFFDDFEDRDLSDWTSPDSSTLCNFSIRSGYLVHIDRDAVNGCTLYRGKPWTADEIILEFDYYEANIGGSLNYWFFGGGVDADYDPHIWTDNDYSPVGDFDFQHPEGTKITTGYFDKWYHIKMKVNYTSSNIDFVIDGTTYAGFSFSRTSSKAGIRIRSGGGDTGERHIDNIKIYKYTSPEPTATTGTSSQIISSRVKIPYWIENKSDGEWAYVWIKVPYIKANANTTVYLYYGNPSAVNESNGDAVFEFFDDFEGTALDTSKWDVDTQAGYMDGSASTFPLNNGEITISSGGIYSKKLFNYGYAFKVRLKQTAQGYGGYSGLGFLNPSTNTDWTGTYANYRVAFWQVDGNPYIAGIDGNAQQLSATVLNKYYLWYGAWDFSETKFKRDSELVTITDSIDHNNRFGIYAEYWNAYTEVVVDYVFIRKYSSPEPTASVSQAEENYTASASSRSLSFFVYNMGKANLGREFVVYYRIDGYENITHINLSSDLLPADDVVFKIPLPDYVSGEIKRIEVRSKACPHMPEIKELSGKVC